ncbi:MAG: ABC transporter ATP-binding protein [Firmicutes bacterium]|nr:ABC transporter ATP-binding protein [Bacillota bacterium]
MSVEPLLEVTHLSKSFRVHGQTLQAVRDVSFTLAAGETLGLVGESGSGKSTLGRSLLWLLPPETGDVRFAGERLRTLSKQALRSRRKDMQIVFQDPVSALNPRANVFRNIEEPLLVHRMGTARERRQEVARLLSQVGLQEAHGLAYPFELSGGQQQRVMIARALALQPKLVVCDEMLSALDMSVQTQMMALLQQLQQEHHLAYVFISHNLSAVGYLSSHIAVMYLGKIVEYAPTEQLVASPVHPYTATLFQSILHIPESKAARSALTTLPGEIPSPVKVPMGCAFHTRCPHVQDVCRTQEPPSIQVAQGHFVACHLAKGDFA